MKNRRDFLRLSLVSSAYLALGAIVFNGNSLSIKSTLSERVITPENWDNADLLAASNYTFIVRAGSYQFSDRDLDFLNKNVINWQYSKHRLTLKQQYRFTPVMHMGKKKLYVS